MTLVIERDVLTRKQIARLTHRFSQAELDKDPNFDPHRYLHHKLNILIPYTFVVEGSVLIEKQTVLFSDDVDFTASAVLVPNILTKKR